MLESSGSSISMAERTAVLLAGLPSEFEGVVSSASLSPTPLPFPQLVEALLECETRHAQTSQEVVYDANLVEDVPMDGSSRGGRSGARGRGRTFRPRLQCQIYSRFGHVAQKCYYRYHRDESSPVSLPPQDQTMNFNSGDGGWSSLPNTRPKLSNFAQQLYGSNQVNCTTGQNYFGPGQNAKDFGQNWCAVGPGQNAKEFGQNWGAVGPGQNAKEVGQNWCAVGPGQNAEEFGQNWGAEAGYNVQRGGQQVGPNGWPKSHDEQRPPTSGPHAGGPIDGVHGGFGVSSYGGPSIGLYVRPSVPPPMPTNSFVNNVQLDPANPIGTTTVPWRTKPHARVFSASNPCFGLPRLGDIHASNYSDPSISSSHANSDRYRVSGDESYSPIPGPVGTSSWYPDSGASNHVCQDPSDLKHATPY
ncbi:hypothetical protein V6Z11_D09G142900 [Gossypium hirsutum]|uniref:Uncharacterized protein n=1 Tax=Gossypium hirsutum TaxID=3635 RepID=A0A1U8HZW4_GOSHI|nr:uncharacterized protein LOC107891297 [Gossypium hirsutum]